MWKDVNDCSVNRKYPNKSISLRRGDPFAVNPPTQFKLEPGAIHLMHSQARSPPKRKSRAVTPEISTLGGLGVPLWGLAGNRVGHGDHPEPRTPYM